jgi:hypothetical protein
LPSLETVKNQISRLSKAKTFLDSYEVELLPDYMEEDETILLALKGSHVGLEGAIFCTEERILFIYKGLNDQRVESIEYHEIDHVYYESNGFSETMELFKMGKRIIFSSLMGDDAKLLEQLITERKTIERVVPKVAKTERKNDSIRNAFEPQQSNAGEHPKKRGLFYSLFGCLGVIFLLIILIASCTAFTAGIQSDESTESTTPVNNEVVKEKDNTNSKPSVVVQKPKENNNAIHAGEKMVFNDYAEISIDKHRFAQKVNPSRPGDFYTYYEEKNKGNVYFDVIGSLKNLQNDDIDLTFGNPVDYKLVYDGKYEYDGQTVVESGDGSDFEMLSYVEPLSTIRFHFLISVPKEIENSNKSLVLKISYDNKEYEYVIR